MPTKFLQSKHREPSPPTHHQSYILSLVTVLLSPCLHNFTFLWEPPVDRTWVSTARTKQNTPGHFLQFYLLSYFLKDFRSKKTSQPVSTKFLIFSPRTIFFSTSSDANITTCTVALRPITREATFHYYILLLYIKVRTKCFQFFPLVCF